MLFRALVLWVSFASVFWGSDSYAGPETCASCHKNIASTQAETAMANTWRGTAASLPALNFDEGPLHYSVRHQGDTTQFSAGKLTVPVREMVGGQRHGVSFLLGLDQLGGIPLERPALLEGRYALSHTGSLVLSPGFRKEQPADQEDALGRTLSPAFETRCLACHGKPDTLGAGKTGGVRCESCHGPAADHIASVATSKLIRPARLKGAAGMEVCAQCHSGLSNNNHIDPMPQDLLVSSQVLALRNSECFRQSAEKLTCTGCHNPHADSSTVAQTSVATCLTCHSSSAAPHAGLCPVNRTGGCVGCHMPTVPADSFRLTDHWIRVHPDTAAAPAKPPDVSLRSQIVPQREYLRLIVAESDEKMKAVTERLHHGDDFSAVAHDLSIDPTAPGGGFLGDEALSDMDPKLAAAAAHLPHDANSEVVLLDNRRIILHRLPRDFKWEANKLYDQAVELNNQGDYRAAAARNQEALQVYPYFLRALILMGSILGETGHPDRAAQVLSFAVQSYPKDAFAQFNLALTLVRQPADQIQALRRAIELDPDMVAAYESLGAALYSSGQPAAAIQTFRQGLQIDPLSAVLYFDLGLALQQQGNAAEAKKAHDLALLLDPKISATSPSAPSLPTPAH